MHSTSVFEPKVSVRDVSLHFSHNSYPEVSLRGQFVKMVKSPLETLLSKRDSTLALKNISFEAEKGDRIALIGKNGAGKTTLCRCLSGIYKPQRGDIQIAGKVKSIIDPSAVIYPELTGRENAAVIMALMYPEEQKLQKEKLHKALEFSGLGDHLDKPFRYYSNGMQTRLCLSLATCSPSDIFILDEVFEGADMEFKELISQRILDLISQSGIVFFVSHSEDQIRRVCNKAVLLHQGESLMWGSVDEVLKEYHSVVYEGA